MNETCVVAIRRGDTWHSRTEPCGKPSKGTLHDGSPACGVHLRSERLETERRESRDAYQERIAAVNAALGIKAFGWDPRESVSVSLEDLERLAQRADLGVEE